MLQNKVKSIKVNTIHIRSGLRSGFDYVACNQCVNKCKDDYFDRDWDKYRECTNICKNSEACRFV
jgi:hypothetical protein